MNSKKPMNVYKKIQKVRAELVSLNLKKTGKNNYSNFTYYELGDFLPSLNKLMNDEGLMTRFVITEKEMAVLEVFNSDNPEERVVFRSRTAKVEIGKKRDGTGGAEPIQNLGGKITYMRRYLLMIAFEISDNDMVDRAKNATQTPTELDAKSLKKINKAKNLKELNAVSREIKETKGSKYEKSLINNYTRRKGELENETA